MSPSSPVLRTLLQTVETLAIALAGGVALSALHFPGGLVSGSMLAVAAAAMLRRPVKIPIPLARACYIVIGILLGSVVTPQTIKGFAAWPVSILLIAVAAICMIVATALYLRYVHRWDPLSAVMGASPGSMSQVIALSSELGANLRAVAVVQTMRILLLTLGIPGGLALFGFVVPAVPVRGPAGVVSVTDLALVIVVSTSAAFLFWRLRFPAGLLFGSMTGAGILYGAGFVHAPLPWWAASAAALGLGAVVGSRFADSDARSLVGYLGAGLGSFAVSLAVATLFAVIVTYLVPFSLPNVVVAFAPGAQDTMMVLALALHLDPIYIGVHHIARFLVVTFSIAVAARRFVRGDRDVGK
jgi:membrane AbrB-like protein